MTNGPSKILPIPTGLGGEEKERMRTYKDTSLQPKETIGQVILVARNEHDFEHDSGILNLVQPKWRGRQIN
jgi:hypothetical protein